MPIPKSIAQIPTSTPIVRVVLTSAKGAKGGVKLQGALQYSIDSQTGEPMGERNIDLFPHLTVEQTSQLDKLMNDLRAKVEAEALR